MKNLERNDIVSKITTSVGEDKRNTLLLSTELIEHDSEYDPKPIMWLKKNLKKFRLDGESNPHL